VRKGGIIYERVFFFLSFFTSNRFKKLNDFIISPIQIGHVTNSSNCDNRLLNDSIHKISISQKSSKELTINI
jgi:hypothetical protein